MKKLLTLRLTANGAFHLRLDQLVARRNGIEAERRRLCRMME